MDSDELRKTAAKNGVPQAIVEKDYVLSVILAELSRSKLKDKVAFKGGTAIKKVYFHEARFSEDLDFSCLNTDQKEIVESLKERLENKEISGVSFNILKQEKTTAGLQMSLKFTSFLGHPQSIRFDFSLRKNLVSKPVEMELIDDYSLGKFALEVFSLEELFAEKIHAVVSRTAARDLYDIWFLMNKEAKIEPDIVRKKFSYYGEKFDYSKLKEKIELYEPKWEKDLRQLLKKVPPFEKVSNEVLTRIEKMHLGDDPMTTDTPGVHNPRFP